jgi:hypothetical protein
MKKIEFDKNYTRFMGEITLGGWTLWMAYIYSCNKTINTLRVDSCPRSSSNGKGSIITTVISGVENVYNGGK